MNEEDYVRVPYPSERYFKFLVLRHGFKGPFVRQAGHGHQVSYVNGLIVINLSCSGGCQGYITKLRRSYPRLESGEQYLSDVEYRDQYSKNLLSLLSKTEYREYCLYSYCRSSEAELSFLSQLVKLNPEILLGDWRKFSAWFRIKQAIRRRCRRLI